VRTVAFHGVGVIEVETQVTIASGLAAFTIVGKFRAPPGGAQFGGAVGKCTNRIEEAGRRTGLPCAFGNGACNGKYESTY
jgi:hypothetical protein